MWPFKYPYTNFHDLNLDWILEQVKENKKNIESNTGEIDGIKKTNFQPFVDSAVKKTVENGIFQSAIEAAMGAFVTVKEFGAVGDGVTDDSDSFISAVSSGHKTIIVPEGNYRITKSIPIPDGVKLVGFNQATSILRPDNMDTPVLLNERYPEQGRDITVENISIIGQSDYTKTSNDGLLFNCSKLTLSNVAVAYMGGNGIRTNGMGDLVPVGGIIESAFSNIICLGCGLSGFRFDGANDSTFVDCHFVSNGQGEYAATYGSANLYINNAAKIIACHCWNYANVSSLKKPPYGVIVNATGAKFVACDIEGGAGGNLYVSGDAYKTIFTDCYFYAPGDTADSIIKEYGHNSAYRNCYVWGDGVNLISAFAANPVDRVEITNVNIDTPKTGIALVGGNENVISGYYSGGITPYTLGGATKTFVMMLGDFDNAYFPHFLFPYEIQ